MRSLVEVVIRVKMSESRGFQLGTVGALSLSVVSSVSIVICNKALISTLGFHFATTLTSWHLLVTFCSLHVALQLKLFEHKPFDRRAVLGFGILNGISIGLLNLSLGFNSVGFYQRSCFWLHFMVNLNRKKLNCSKILPYGDELETNLSISRYNGDEDLDPQRLKFTLMNILSTFGNIDLSLSCISKIASCSFFQMTKLAIIPCTVLLETVFLNKKFSRSVQLSLTVLLLGVGIATVTDLQLNALGSFLSLLAVLTTCVAQIMTNTIQKKFKVSSTQLLYQSCPYQSATLLITGPFLDKLLTDENVFAFNYTTQVLVFIILSCMISVSVNFSTFLVIGKTSPVTYQVLGHLKTCLVLAFGYTLLHDPFSWRNILGILVALGGMILYSYYCTREGQRKTSDPMPQMPQVKGDESDPLMKLESGAKVST
ncbi:hypothetical protein V2J09_017543 [Rumex salicifolius]